MHARTGDGDAIHIDALDRSVQPVGIRGERFAQLDQAEVVVVESFAGVKRGLRGVSDEGGRDLIAFTEPEFQNVSATDARVGDFADARCR
jgi:hypothetical protein